MKELSEKVKAILRDGRKTNLYQYEIADRHAVCQAYVCMLFKRHHVLRFRVSYFLLTQLLNFYL
jgi:hypothetical protein